MCPHASERQRFGSTKHYYTNRHQPARYDRRTFPADRQQALPLREGLLPHLYSFCRVRTFSVLSIHSLCFALYRASASGVAAFPAFRARSISRTAISCSRLLCLPLKASSYIRSRSMGRRRRECTAAQSQSRRPPRSWCSPDGTARE